MVHHGRSSVISKSARDWTLWLASVLAAAVVINIAASSYMTQGTLPSVAKSRTTLTVQQRTRHRSLASAGVTEITADSTLVHLHGLSRRDQCASPGTEETVSDLPLRIGAVAIILVVSFGACVFPILAARFSKLKVPAGFFFAVRHFGTGVLLATAFVHLLPTAFTLLGDPCLPAFWNEDYPAVPGAIALTGIFIVTSVEMLLHPAHKLSGAAAAAPTEPGTLQARSTLRSRSVSMNQSLSQIARGQPQSEELDAPNQGAEVLMIQPLSHDKLDPEQQLKKETLHVLLLEMGILFHSVFIGMALSVSFDAKEFVILLVAIVFHRRSPPCLRY
jgi:solute carrier family 39 (zinc transporter), member 1/2/3